MPQEDLDHAVSYEVLVTAEAFKGVFALSVDAALGVQQVVLREIKGISCDTEAMAGGALLGDGSVALIIDPEKLLDRRERPVLRRARYSAFRA